MIKKISTMGLMAILSILMLANMVSPYVGFAAQGKAKGEQDEERIRVVYQITDVRVKDNRGRFVRNLTKDDFILTIDGKPVDIRTVDEFAAQSMESQLKEADSNLADQSLAEVESLEAPSTPPRYVIIVFDRYNMWQKGMQESKKAAKELVLNSLLPTDKVAVFMINKTISTLTGPTSDRARILEAIDNANAPSLNTNYFPKAVEMFPPVEATEVGELQMLLIEKETEFQSYINMLKVLAKAISAMPGRKTFLVFSDGPNIRNPMSREAKRIMMANANAGVTNGAVTMQGENLTDYLTPEFINRQFQELSKQLSSANTTLYTIRRGSIQPEWTTGVSQDLQNAYSGNPLLPGASVSGAMSDMQRQKTDVLNDFASMSNGKFYNAGVSMDKLITEVRNEVGDYYILGFVPPNNRRGDFHHISIKCKNPEYSVIHRQGFFEEKSIERMTDRERDIHLEEGFMVPGMNNQLGMETKAVRLPVRSWPTAIVSFAVDAKNFEANKDGNYEMELVLNVEDRNGMIRYRDHKIFKTSKKFEKGEKIYHSLTVPLLDDACAAYLAVRDNIGGLRSTWREIFPPMSGKESVFVTSPVILQPEGAGNVTKWEAKKVKDEARIIDPIMPMDIKLPGVPAPNSVVNQGQDVKLMILMGNFPKGANLAGVKASTSCFLDPRGEESYRLKVSNENTYEIRNRGVLVVEMEVPLGLSQKPAAVLGIALQGIVADRVLLSRLPFTINPFSNSQATKLLDDPRITQE
jgi:VWFA-related protein